MATADTLTLWVVLAPNGQMALALRSRQDAANIVEWLSAIGQDGYVVLEASPVARSKP